MQRIVLILTILWLWLSSSNWSQPSQTVVTEGMTATPTIAVQYKKILDVPPVVSNHGIVPVEWVAWNPVASDFAAIYEDGNAIRILDANTGSTTQTLAFQGATYNSVFSWSPDGKHIAALVAAPNNIIKIWALSESPHEAPITINRPGDHSAYPIFWSPDGRKLAETEAIVATPVVSSEAWSRVLFIWDTQTGKVISSHADTTIGSWSPDGKKMVVLVGPDYHESLEIVNPDTFQVLFTFPQTQADNMVGATPGSSLYVIWTPDSRQVIGGTCDSEGNCTLWSWDAQTGQADKRFDQTNIQVGVSFISEDTFALNASGTLLASTFWNGLQTVYLWDVQSGRLLNSLSTNDGITSLSWDHSQDILVLGSKDGTIQEWEVQRTSESPTEVSK